MSKVCLMCGDTFPDSTTFCPKDGSALRAAVHGDDIVGEVFCDRYVVTDLLGEGGMGAVYVARDVRLPQQVAIKVLRDRAGADPSVVARFRQEAEAASRINHDRVARVSDFGFMNDGRAYIIMEYVSGRTLKQVLEERGPLPLTDVSKITTMVAEGLDAAHRLGIVHRDLKPENVMIVDDAGGGMRVKVLDFGIAKVLQGEESAGRTAPGFVIGTPQWMSPEQILGETLDARSDVFALGLLAYSMITGQRAYSGNSEQGEMMARLSSPSIPLAEALPDVEWPAGLQALINRTLSRDVSMRPSGALAFARELSKLVEQPTVLTQAAVVIEKKPDTGGSGRTIAIAASGVLVLALVGVFVVRKFGGGTGTTTAPSVGVPPAANGAPTDSQPVVSTPPAGIPVSAPVNTPATTPTTAATNPDTQKTAAAQKPTAVKTVPPKPSTPAGRSGNVPVETAPVPATSVPSAPSGPTVSAHDQLQTLMDDADADIGTNIDAATARAKARDLIRKIETLLPKLTNTTDQGWANFFIGQSRATLGENDLACSALAKALPLATQSNALRSSIERTRKAPLNCGP